MRAMAQRLYRRLQRRADDFTGRRADLDGELLAVAVLAPHRITHIAAAVVGEVEAQGLGPRALAAGAELRRRVAGRGVGRPRRGHALARRLDLVDLLPAPR